MFFQIVNSCIRCRQKIHIIRMNPQNLKRFDIIINTLGRIICDKYKLSAIRFDIFQKCGCSLDQLVPLADGTVYVQQKKFFIFQHILRFHFFFDLHGFVRIIGDNCSYTCADQPFHILIFIDCPDADI